MVQINAKITGHRQIEQKKAYNGGIENHLLVDSEIMRNKKARETQNADNHKIGVALNRKFLSVLSSDLSSAIKVLMIEIFSATLNSFERPVSGSSCAVIVPSFCGLALGSCS